MPIDTRSLYAAPGKLAFGSAGFVEAKEKLCGGFVIAFCARARQATHFTTPRFVKLTVDDAMKGKGEGKKPMRANFLALQIVHVPGREDLIALRGNWVLDVDLFFKHYDVKNMKLTDPLSKRSINALQPGDYILDSQWYDATGFMSVELSTIVTRELTQSNDPDAIALRWIIRRHMHGKKSSWPRLESIADLVETARGAASEAADWTMRELMALRLGEPELLARYAPPTLPDILVDTYSGLEPLRPSFPPVRRDIFYVRDMTVRVGGGPGKPTHCIEYVDDDDPDETLHIGHVLFRVDSPDQPIRCRRVVPLRCFCPPATVQALTVRSAPCPTATTAR